jgi:hypothetical protein
MSTRNLSLETHELLGRLWTEAQSKEEKEKLQFAIDALNFIYETGQTYDFKDYRERLNVEAPPLVIASFKTRAEADAWLNAHPNPPYHANILIGGNYHYVMYSREKNDRSIVSAKSTIPYYLGDMIRKGVPSPVASFNTHEDAEAWVHAQPEAPRQVFIQIAGETYLVAYHENINLRAIYPVSIAKFANYGVSKELDR